ncbi:MAG: hypothetical protein LHW64_10555 [Candidatus Cloacimonetes bacterium]|nr:hypothetical protein [Candidatus Cloacimonadota bacterium]MDY0230552.1 hypothetical protein [Candidatus Cloacimonadaceae bacterium]
MAAMKICKQSGGAYGKKNAANEKAVISDGFFVCGIQVNIMFFSSV